ncbi:AAA family ATPase [Pseudoduganella sp. FT25W]|uniref:AAA family ATPase n=1 Tax=Duganella alba TaxID=2666081 RepID=A0A6L5QJ07_9BURK|nr:ATP-binding protein [Duganella alba]MRX08981.1 AAA family ATPase [Duganella alba]MRX18973.1 AAA family ATPase [Duganella alba]
MTQCLTESPSLTDLWLLRILVPLGGHKALLARNAFSNEAVARAAGLGRWLDDDECDFDAAAIRDQLRQAHRAAEARRDGATTPAVLTANMTRLAALVDLSPSDCRILEFAILLHSDRILDDCADTLGAVDPLRVADTLAHLLALEADDVHASLSPQGVLAKSGLLALDANAGFHLGQRLDLPTSHFANHIVAYDAHPLTLLRDTIGLSDPPRLTLADFGHLQQALAILRPYLAQALAAARAGVNVFIHGAPGTGKTELARALAADIGCELFEVASADAEGDPVNGERRLRAHRAAQHFFGRRNALILFDEAEDVFNNGDGMGGRKSIAQRRKAWLNRTLEHNKVPTLWLSNAIDGVDPAFLRRFDMVIEMPIAPRAQRERIVRAVCADLLDERAIAHVAAATTLAPAVVSRAAEVVRSLGDKLDQPGASRAVQWLIDQSLQAQGQAPLRLGDASRLPAEYDAALLNADTDLPQLADGLLHSRSARLCLYGPPGTGKTAYARWLAQHLDQPLMLYSASDLMSKWAGDSEKKIAAAFRDAERENAVLLIDEVDSFLQDRARARQSWEITLVNEMLTRMEAYSGLFIASTNLMDHLDPAALRRFDLKICFHYLRPEQAQALLERYCANLFLTAPAADAVALLRRLHAVTPGDFSAVARQHRFRPLAGATAFVQALAQECKLKEKTAAAIGFLT